LTVLNIPQLDGRVPEEQVQGHTPDISPYIQFDFYEAVYYWDPVLGFPDERKRLGRWLGIAESCTDIMACYVLKENGEVIVLKSV